MMSLRLAQPYSATSSFHLQSQPWRLNLNTNTNTNTNTNMRFNLKHRSSKTSISSRRTVPIIRAAASKVPARDVRITFGKHKGQMLGSIPPSYLKWVAENVLEWSDIVKVVLEDPVYQDRIEWDFYDRIVNPPLDRRRSDYVDVDIIECKEEMAERFGWDLEDVMGWIKVKNDLLGTSYSGRIPRMADREKRLERERAARAEIDRKIEERKAARPFVGGERRRERLERQRAKRQVVAKKKPEPEVITGTAAAVTGEEEKKRTVTGRRFLGKYGVGGAARAPRSDNEDDNVVVDDDDDSDRTVRKVYNPFPGRVSLLKRAIDSKKRK